MILPRREPMPAFGKTQVEAQLAQCLVSQMQLRQPRPPLARICLLQPLAQVERSVERALRKGVAMRTRKVIGRRQQPRQQVEAARKNGHLFFRLLSHRIAPTNTTMDSRKQRICLRLQTTTLVHNEPKSVPSTHPL